MKYRPYKSPEDDLSAGDIRRYTATGGGLAESFYVVVMSVSSDTVRVRRLYKENLAAARYLIRDVGPTGLEYAMFIDPKDIELPKRGIGRRLGRLSKTDMRNIWSN